MNWLVLLLTLGFVLAEGVIAYWEGTFNSTKFPFWQHGGIWADLLVLTIINGLVINHLAKSHWLGVTIPVFFVVSFVAMVFLHQQWYATQIGFSSWIWPHGPHIGGDWLKEMSLAGRGHLLFSALEFTILLLCLISPLPPKVAVATAALLTLFCLLAVVQPCYFITGKWLDKAAILASLGIISLSWCVAAFRVATRL